MFIVAAFVLDERRKILFISKRFETRKDALKAIKELQNDSNEKRGIFLLTHK
jgi:hypothetical protein